MTIAAQRLAQIEHSYFADETTVKRALELFHRATARRTKRHLRLDRLLRDHGDSPVTDRETRMRDDFDSLLAYFSMVEIACMAGYLPDSLPQTYRMAAKRVLWNPDVKRYYTDNYPLYLPQVHALRLAARPPPKDLGAAAEGQHIFGSFFALSQMLETSVEVETFMWCLDDGERDGFDLDDVIKALRKPKKFLKCISARAEDFDDDELDVVSAAVQGFIRFTEFAPRFRTLLLECAKFPLLQSALWHFHGYWFGQMGLQMGSDVRRAIEAVINWERALTPGVRRRASQRLLDRRVAANEQETALEHLSSGRFSYYLVESLMTLRSGVDPNPGTPE